MRRTTLLCMRRDLAVIAALCTATVAVALHGMAIEAAPDQEGAAAIEGLAFFTFNYGPDVVISRCKNVVSVVRHQRDEWLLDHRYSRASLASLRASPDLRTVVAGMGTEFWSQPFSDTLRASRAIEAAVDEPQPYGAIYVMRRLGEGIDRWSIATTAVGPSLYHGIEILPDDDTLLVATAAWVRGQRGGQARAAPFRIEQYSLAELAPIPAGPDRPGSHHFGPPRQQLELPRPAVALMADGTATRVYALTRALQVTGNPAAPVALALHTIDPIRMVEVAPPILMPDWIGHFGEHYLPMMALHPGGHIAATTSGMQPTINIADLSSGTVRSIPVADADAVMDVAFSFGTFNHGMLAIIVRKMMDPDETRLAPWASVKSQVRVGALANGAFDVHGTSGWTYGPMPDVPAALDWAADGTGIVAALDHPLFDRGGPAKAPLAVYMTVSDGGTRVEISRELHPCREPAFVMDVLTTNGRLPTGTPTLTTQPSPTPNDTPTPWPTPTATPTPSATASPTPLPTPTPSAPPRPIYLPIGLRERCLTDQVRQDVVLVLDTSSSMAAGTRAGRSKIDAAREAALGYLALLKLDDGDRAAVVTFDATAQVAEHLSSRRPALEIALRDASLGTQTCIPCAMEAAAAELAPPRRRVGNTPVIVLLTDGRSNPRPASEAVDLAVRAKDSGIVIYTIGLGDDLELDALLAMASRPSFFLRAPDGEDLAAIYASIAVEVPCPAARYRGGQ